MSAQMKLDHYVARTYLKHFGDPALHGRLNAYRKSGGRPFQPWPADVCRDWGDDLNVSFLPHRPELLGDYRAIFEPVWNRAIGTLSAGRATPEEKFAIAGYLANLMTCTPTWRRVGVEVHNDHARAFLLFSKETKDRHRGNPDLPDDAIEMLRAGEISLDHDPDYVKAVVTRRLLDTAWAIFRQPWTVLTSPTSEKFITSDNPSALSCRGPGGVVTRHFPLTPEMCVEIVFVDPRPKPMEVGTAALWLTESGAPIVYAPVTATAVRRVNRVVIENAEEMVFCSTPSEAAEKLALKFANHRVYHEYVEHPGEDGRSIYQASILRVGRPVRDEAVRPAA